MPKVKNPLFSQEARGGIGGLVYNTWRGINYVKTNTSPTGQGTTLRLTAQSYMTTNSKLWAGLSDVQRAAWDQYAADHPVADWTGSPKRLTGMNWFIKTAINLGRLSVSPLTDPPSAAAPVAPSGLEMSKDTTSLDITCTGPTEATKSLIVWLHGPHSKGRTIKIEQCQFALAALGNGTFPAELKASAPVGRYTAFARTVDHATGLQSPWVSTFFDFT